MMMMMMMIKGQYIRSIDKHLIREEDSSSGYQRET
jgi:hypothetical protein